jgi:hypothetical protein
MSVVVMGRTPEIQETPHYLNLYNVCQSFQALPSEGGVLDQDQLIMRRFFVIEAAISEKQERDRKQQEAQRKRAGGR